MKGSIATLFASKRFIVITLTLLICGAFVIAGRMPVDQFVTTLGTLGGLLATLYGFENAAQALKGPPATTVSLETSTPARVEVAPGDTVPR